MTDDENKAVLLINIENFENYKLAYTTLASDKLLQTYSAIIQSTLDETDFLGELSEDTFLIITDTIKAERLAKFLIFAFDTVSEKFYAEHDLDRGYMILQGDEHEGRRVNFVHTTISIITNEVTEYKDEFQILNSLEQIHKMAKLPARSNYLMERPKIQGQDSVIEKEYNNRILIYETDDSLSLLLKTILDMQGYETKIIEEYKAPDKNLPPAIIIIDAGDVEKKNGLNLCHTLKQNEVYNNTKIIVTSIIHDKQLVLNTGADLYLPKPYEVSKLIKWVNEFMKEFNG